MNYTKSMEKLQRLAAETRASARNVVPLHTFTGTALTTAEIAPHIARLLERRVSPSDLTLYSVRTDPENDYIEWRLVGSELGDAVHGKISVYVDVEDGKNVQWSFTVYSGV